MGTVLDDSGMTLQLYNTAGTPDGDPYFGRFVRIAGRKQDEITSTAPLTEDEKIEPGSDDWLTLVAVADTQERLDDILNGAKVKALEPLALSQSSHSSRRVLVEMHVRERRESFETRITIASGPLLSLDGQIKIKVAHVKVLAAGTKFDQNHPLFKEFRGGKPAFLKAKQ
jgi:hypothetical protein